MYQPMRMSTFLVDTDQNSFVCGRFSLPSDIHRSIGYANIVKITVNVRKLF